jgi:flagellar hook-length control protein FliK
VNKAFLSREGNQLSITLKPEGLGKLDINLSLDRGLLNAQIHVSDPAIKTLLENNLQQLVNSLTHEGLSVDGFSVSLRNNGSGQEQAQDPNGFLKQPAEAFNGLSRRHTLEQNGQISIFV